MDNSREYEYVMELSEIREFCRFAHSEQLKCYKRMWLTWMLFGLILLVGAWVLMMKIYLDIRNEAGSVSARVPLGKQVEVLASMGLDVPEKTGIVLE